jgi:hypothetical protein
LGVLRFDDLWPSRPPCSVAERVAADAVRARMRHHGLRPAVERTRAPTSPTWAPLLRALFRVWCAAFLAASWPSIAIGLGAASIIGGVPFVAGWIRFLPLLGAPSRNVVASKRGRDTGSRAIVVTAHLDTHSTFGAPLHRAHVLVAAASGWLALGASLAARANGITWRWAVVLIATESVVTMGWLAKRELATPTEVPDDNTSGLLALVRVAELVADGSLEHDVWIVATAAGTVGSYGVNAFLRQHPALRDAWLVEIDALGTGEMVASPCPPRFPNPGTPSPLVRAFVAAAREIGDPLAVRRMRRPHSDARAALRLRVPAIALTAGLHAPAGGPGPDAANAERAARIVDSFARSRF